ncbi:MAG: hypothetical protein K2L07_04170 [Lachnospiraceae bacterium]|nr:hypothetical protein [Lachnospiraceae bacterium]
MNIVVYFEITRKKKRMLKYIVWPIIFSVILFAVCMAVDGIFPNFNNNYMKWPDMLKDLLCLRSWTSHLWLNVWQFFMLAYPFYLIYNIMKEQAQAISEEERLETIVYLHNAGVSRRELFAAKWFVWMGEMVLCCLSLAVVNVVSAAILRYTQGIWNALKYYGILFLVCMLYLVIALFAAACKGKKDMSGDTIVAILIIPLLVSRIPAFLRFFSALLVLTGREGAIVDKISQIGTQTEILTAVSPLTWCWPDMQITAVHIIFGVVVYIVMLTAGFSIYTHRRQY